MTPAAEKDGTTKLVKQRTMLKRPARLRAGGSMARPPLSLWNLLADRRLSGMARTLLIPSCPQVMSPVGRVGSPAARLR